MKAETRTYLELICQLLSGNSRNMTEVDMCVVTDYIRDEGVEMLVSALQRNSQVHSLLLIDSNFSLRGSRAIGELLQSNTCLKHCVLNENMRIRDGGVAAIADGLFVNSTLQTIMLEQVEMGPEGTRAMAGVLEVNRNLKELSLGRNDPSEAIFDLAQSMRVNQTLVRLELGHCKIQSPGASALFEALGDHSSLEVLDLTQNLLDDEVADSLEAMLKGSNTMRYISLTLNNLSDRAAEAIGAGLECNTALQELLLHSNNIKEIGAQALGRSMPKMTGLSELGMNRNPIKKAGRQALVDGMKHNKSIQSIQIRFAILRDPFQEAASFYARRNKRCWDLLQHEQLPLGMWAHVFGKVKSDPDIAFFFLTEKPSLLKDAKGGSTLAK
jgi:Ran GTPase-activating protein (RanGAP) involved in mRNA processing and transport